MKLDYTAGRVITLINSFSLFSDHLHLQLIRRIGNALAKCIHGRPGNRLVLNPFTGCLFIERRHPDPFLLFSGARLRVEFLEGVAARR
jgi:hypothetical protein